MSRVIKLFTVRFLQRQVIVRVCCGCMNVWCKHWIAYPAVHILKPALKSIQRYILYTLCKYSPSPACVSVVKRSYWSTLWINRLRWFQKQNIDHKNCFTCILSAGLISLAPLQNVSVHTICACLRMHHFAEHMDTDLIIKHTWAITSCNKSQSHLTWLAHLHNLKYEIPCIP